MVWWMEFHSSIVMQRLKIQAIVWPALLIGLITSLIVYWALKESQLQAEIRLQRSMNIFIEQAEDHQLKNWPHSVKQLYEFMQDYAEWIYRNKAIIEGNDDIKRTISAKQLELMDVFKRKGWNTQDLIQILAYQEYRVARPLNHNLDEWIQALNRLYFVPQRLQ